MSEQDRRQNALWEWAKLPQETQEALAETFRKARSLEDFIAIVMVGPCPRCGSEKTMDGEDAGFPIPDAGDTTVGICAECGYRWCLECGADLPTWPCPHWDSEEEGKENDEA